MPFQAWIMKGVLADLLSHVSGVILQSCTMAWLQTYVCLVCMPVQARGREGGLECAEREVLQACAPHLLWRRLLCAGAEGWRPDPGPRLHQCEKQLLWLRSTGCHVRQSLKDDLTEMLVIHEREACKAAWTLVIGQQ